MPSEFPIGGQLPGTIHSDNNVITMSRWCQATVHTDRAIGAYPEPRRIVERNEWVNRDVAGRAASDAAATVPAELFMRRLECPACVRVGHSRLPQQFLPRYLAVHGQHDARNFGESTMADAARQATAVPGPAPKSQDTQLYGETENAVVAEKLKNRPESVYPGPLYVVVRSLHSRFHNMESSVRFTGIQVKMAIYDRGRN